MTQSSEAPMTGLGGGWLPPVGLGCHQHSTPLRLPGTPTSRHRRGDAEQRAGRRRRALAAVEPDLVDLARGRRGEVVDHELDAPPGTSRSWALPLPATWPVIPAWWPTRRSADADDTPMRPPRRRPAASTGRGLASRSGTSAARVPRRGCRAATGGTGVGSTSRMTLRRLAPGPCVGGGQRQRWTTFWNEASSSRQTAHVSDGAGSPRPRRRRALRARRRRRRRRTPACRWLDRVAHGLNSLMAALAEGATRSLVRPSRILPFTVPAGSSSISAIWVWLNPPKYASSITWR